MEIKKVGELIIQDKSGIYGLGLSAEPYNGKVRYLRITDIDDSGNLLDQDKKSVTTSQEKDYLLQQDDLVVARTGNSTGRTYVYDASEGPMVYAGFLIKYVFDKSKINPRYLKYFTTTSVYRNQTAKYSGSTRGNMSAQDFKNIKIAFPDRTTQDKMVVLFDLINKKMISNNKIKVELESLAKTLYDYWFLQFDFPNEEGKPYKSSGGKMVWNTILKRDIPEGWETTELLDLVEWITNSQPPKSEFKYNHEAGYIRFIQNRDYESNGHITYVPQKKSMNKVGRLDILIDKYGDAGLVRYGIEGVFNVALAQIKPKNIRMREYIRSTMLSNSMYTYFHNSCMASTRASLSEENLKLVFIIKPPIIIYEKFEEVISSMRKNILKINDENQELISMRDFLLPLLMNGQVTFR